MADEYTPTAVRQPSRSADWDEIETGFHEYASWLTQQELASPGGHTSYPRDFADWQVAMRAARQWLAEHDARVRAEAAREALDGLAEDFMSAARGCAEDGDHSGAGAWRNAAGHAFYYRDHHHRIGADQ